MGIYTPLLFNAFPGGFMLPALKVTSRGSASCVPVLPSDIEEQLNPLQGQTLEKATINLHGNSNLDKAEDYISVI